MNINHTFQYLQMGLPERINRKKLFGDFEGALQDMESYLLTPFKYSLLKYSCNVNTLSLHKVQQIFLDSFTYY